MATRKNSGKGKAKTKAQIAAAAKSKAKVETKQAEDANKAAAEAIAEAGVESGEAEDANKAAAEAIADADAAAIEGEAIALEKEIDIIGNGKSSEREVVKEVKEADSFIKVRPVRAEMYDPFQRVRIPEGADTPLVNSGWVKSQVAAGLLIRC